MQTVFSAIRYFVLYIEYLIELDRNGVSAGIERRRQGGDRKGAGGLPPE